MLPTFNPSLDKSAGPLWVHQRRFVLLKFGGGITEMRGSIAGNVYSRNRSGAYMRARTKPVNPNTTRQQAIRAAIAFVCARWSETLTKAHRDAWGVYGANVPMKNRLGETIYLSGFNHYIRSNAGRVQLGFAAIDTAPVIFELPAKDPSIAIAPDAGDQLLNFSFDNTMAWANEDDGVLYLYQGLPQNAQRNFFGGPWRWVMCVGGDSITPPTSPDVAPCVFAIGEGQHQWIYCRIQRADGRLSEQFRADAFCSA